MVGHGGIIAGLVPLMLTRSRLQVRLRSAVHNAAWHGAAFAATLVVLGIGYFGLHELYIAPKAAPAPTSVHASWK